jgi:hypothetical protein
MPGVEQDVALVFRWSSQQTEQRLLGLIHRQLKIVFPLSISTAVVQRGAKLRASTSAGLFVIGTPRANSAATFSACPWRA